MAIVEIDGSHRLLAERIGGERLEPRELGRGVSVERAVVVEMVLGEIGENRDVEGDTVHALLVDAVGRNFHRRAATAVVGHAGEQVVELDRAGRGETGRLRLFAIVHQHRA